MNDIADRLVDLEIRLTEQEAAIEALTKNSLAHDRDIDAVLEQLREVKQALQQMTPPAAGSAADEPPPPHY
ncbi:MAG: SlyX family protein [Gammaproteobacteria bacterium]|nr:SlyX family protein [Gammaproteobacteria bacterium]